MANYKNMGSAVAALKRNFKRAEAQLPAALANVGTNHFTESFKRQGFLDKTLEAWKPRAETKKGKGRAILVKSGALRRAVNNSVVEKGRNRIVWRVSLPYAAVHNEGYKGTQYVKPHKRQATITTRVTGGYSAMGDEKRKGKKVTLLGSRHNVRSFSRKVNIPKRQFMGASTVLNRRFRKKIDQVIMKQITGVGAR